MPAVIEALGNGDKKAGRRELIRLTGRSTQHVTNWIADGRLPSWTWELVKAAVVARGYRIDPALCGIAAASAQAQAS